MTKNKSKKKVKKLRMIGKNLKRDDIGTNQLLNENDINNIVHNIVEKKNDVIIDYSIINIVSSKIKLGGMFFFKLKKFLIVIFGPPRRNLAG